VRLYTTREDKVEEGSTGFNAEGVDFDLDDAQKYLEGLNFPASKEEVLSSAEGNGAPGELIRSIESLPKGEFSEPEDFMNHLRAVPNRDN
jgi:hypothetical protein